MEEIIYWCFHPLPLQSPIALPNQNQTLNIVPLWYIHVSLADGPNGVSVTLNTPFHDAKAGSKLWNISCNFYFPLVHKYT